MLLMNELLICEVLIAVENHDLVDIDAAAQRCRNHMPQYPETDQQLKDRIQHLAIEYGAGVVLH